jgi:hypothetical protein
MDGGRRSMLAKHPSDVMLTAPDMAAVKEFYGYGLIRRDVHHR